VTSAFSDLAGIASASGEGRRQLEEVASRLRHEIAQEAQRVLGRDHELVALVAEGQHPSHGSIALEADRAWSDERDPVVINGAQRIQGQRLVGTTQLAAHDELAERRAGRVFLGHEKHEPKGLAVVEDQRLRRPIVAMEDLGQAGARKRSDARRRLVGVLARILAVKRGPRALVAVARRASVDHEPRVRRAGR
jgi:hypothetical protein